jgi:hypothetical protein
MVNRACYVKLHKSIFHCIKITANRSELNCPYDIDDVAHHMVAISKGSETSFSFS